MNSDIHNEVLLAESCIRPFVRQTILDYCYFLSQETNTSVYCKLENLQHTGSFKVRGAMNKILFLPDEKKSRGVVTASTGNHGAAVAYCLNKLSIKGVVFVPERVPATKINAIERLGAEIRYWGKDPADTEQYARNYAKENLLTYISPYNDVQVAAGQGTIGFELEQQLDRIDAVFVSLGGGGLISGIGGYLKSIHPRIQIIGCSPENSQVMIQSVRAGRILDLPSLPTLSDGTAGGIEPGAITFDLCRKYVDDYITVSENEIKSSLLMFLNTQHMLIEGAAAVAVASFLKTGRKFAGKNVVIIICGANIDPATLKMLL